MRGRGYVVMKHHALFFQDVLLKRFFRFYCKTKLFVLRFPCGHSRLGKFKSHVNF